MNAHPKLSEPFMQEVYTYPSTPSQAIIDSDVEILLCPETEEVVDSPFWRIERPWSLDENMTRGAILMKWKCGAISSVIAVKTLIEFEVFDFDKIIELYDGYLMALSKVEGN